MKPGIESKAVHGGEEEPHPLRSVAAPIFQTSTFTFESFADLRQHVKGTRKAYFYSRYGNPTVDAAAAKVAELENAEAGLVASSGSAAVFTTLLTLLRSGDELIASESIYGGTINTFNLLERFGIKTRYIAANRLEDLDAQATERTRLFWFETPTNPVNRVIDIADAVSRARRLGLTTVIDNTFASPVNQRPLEHGVDVVVHSATKYLGGHSDLTAGAIVGRRDFIKEAAVVLRDIGAILDSSTAYLLVRGMKTLDVRMQRINENSQRIAEALSRHPKVSAVHYPGLESFPDHAIARKQMSGFGGIVAVDLKGGEPAVEQLHDRLQMIKIAASFGGTESHITYPHFTTHARCTPAAIAAAGISDGTVRLSIGIESAADLIADLEQALAEAKPMTSA